MDHPLESEVEENPRSDIQEPRHEGGIAKHRSMDPVSVKPPTLNSNTGQILENEVGEEDPTPEMDRPRPKGGIAESSSNSRLFHVPKAESNEQK